MEFDQNTLQKARDFAKIKGEISPDRLQGLDPKLVQYYKSIVPDDLPTSILDLNTENLKGLFKTNMV